MTGLSDQPRPGLAGSRPQARTDQVLASPAEPDFELVVVGAGRIGQVHMKAVASSTVVRVSAVVEPRGAVRDELARAGMRCFAELGDLITELADAGSMQADGVLIAAPTDRHAELVRQALAAGLPVLCEKPCGLSTAQTQACAAAAAQAGLLLQVAYWRRYVPRLQRLRARIASGEFGDILAIHCSQWDQTPPPAEFRKTSGGIFVDMGVHEFDQVRWLTGQEVYGIEAVTADPAVKASADTDCGHAIARLSGGGTVVVSLGRWHPPGDICRVYVYGTKGTAKCSILQHDDGAQVLEYALRAQLEGFARAVRTGRVSGATVQDAVTALALATQASGRSGEKPG
jgi:myo-inositol 2-dehydrogenase/D-chiro-inositol 1-dehydrogenase